MVDGAERVLRNNSLKILMEFVPDLLRNVGTDPLELLYKLQNYGFEIKLFNERKQVLEPIEDIEEFCRTVESRRKASLVRHLTCYWKNKTLWEKAKHKIVEGVLRAQSTRAKNLIIREGL